MSELDFSVLGTSVSCDERRPTDSGGSWCTDFSVDKVILRLEFEGRCFFDTIRIINNNASHIEVRGGEKSNSPWYDSRKVVEKTLLRNMWDHKTNKNNNSTNLLICSKEFSYQELLIGLYNNWEPPSRIGLESFSIRGRLDGNPQEYTAYSPPVKNGPKIVNSSAGPDPVVVSESKIMSAWCSQPSEARIEQKRKNEITSDVKVSKINTPQSLDLPKPKPKTISNPTVPNVQQIPPPPPGKPLAGVTVCVIISSVENNNNKKRREVIRSFFHCHP